MDESLVPLLASPYLILELKENESFYCARDAKFSKPLHLCMTEFVSHPKEAMRVLLILPQDVFASSTGQTLPTFRSLVDAYKFALLAPKVPSDEASALNSRLVCDEQHKLSLPPIFVIVLQTFHRVLSTSVTSSLVCNTKTKKGLFAYIK